MSVNLQSQLMSVKKNSVMINQLINALMLIH